MQNWEIGVSGMPPLTWVDWWQHMAATSCLAASRSLYKGATTRFPPFHLQQLGLEKESGERKCRFEVSKLFNFVIFVYFGSNGMLKRINSKICIKVECN